jgi:hypothetical protein
MAKNKWTEQEIEEAKDYLRKLLPEHSKVYCSLRSVNRSGMSRVITFYSVSDVTHVDNDGVKTTVYEPIRLNWYMAKVLGLSLKDTDQGNGLVVPGCGMDMGGGTIYNLAYRLYGDGYKLEYTWI